MKKVTLTTITLSLCIAFGFAQKTTTDLSRSLVNAHVVILSLSGNTSIQSTAINEIRIKSFLQPKGDVWGWKFPDKRQDFEIIARTSNDTVYINTPSKYSPATIGVNTYSERIDNIIALPSDKQIIVKQADNLVVEQDIKSMIIETTNVLTIAIHKTEIKSLKCRAKNSLKINEVTFPLAYQFDGTGNNSISIQANSISITLKQ
jgi:hypothetical protein